MSERRSVGEKVRGHVLDAGLGIVVTLGMFAAIELVLLALGVDNSRDTDFSRGFDDRVDYVFPDAEAGGAADTWRTRLGTLQDGKSIPPKGERVRVLLFGGSNTRGFHTAPLMAALREQCVGSHEFEVINLGRPGYGSGRVTTVFRQAVERLDPDFVLVYSGHNEFVELSFRMDIERNWSRGWQSDVAAWAEGTRTAKAVQVFIESRQPARHANVNAWSREYGKFADMQFEQTLEHLDAYRDNLREMASVAAQQGVPMLLSTVVYNRFALPHTSNLPLEWDEDRKEAFIGHRGRAGELLPDWFRPLLPTRPQDRVRVKDWGRRASAPRDDDLPGLRLPVGPFASVAYQFPKGDRSERLGVFYGALARLHGERETDEREALTAAASELDAALELSGDHAQTLFERGLVAWALGERDGRVRDWFEAAARYDRAPRKATPEVNERVRAVADEVEGVQLVELDPLFCSGAELGLVGWELMLDHCHLNPGAVDLAMAEVARVILEELERPNGK